MMSHFREQTINTKKNLVLQDGERQLITSMKKVSASSDKAFTSYCAQKQVAVLRALAGIPSYFNDVGESSLLLLNVANLVEVCCKTGIHQGE
jgi:hypothetical protein